jgi:hypothetical protein
VLQAHQAYKADVEAFFKALPPAAVAKLLRLPEPKWLPKRTAPTRSQQMQQQQQQAATAKPASDAGAGAAAAAAAAAAATLQSSMLVQSWAAHSTAAASNSGDILAGAAVKYSQLARLCCGVIRAVPADGNEAAAAEADESHEADDECLPLLAPPGQQQQQRKASSRSSSPRQQQHCTPAAGKAATAAADTPSDAAAAAAAEFAAACGACCRPHITISDACCCNCHVAVEQLLSVLPPADEVLQLLEHASEGTWLCNPRMLQQPHAAVCGCSVCTGHRACEPCGGNGAGAGVGAGAASAGAAPAVAAGQHGWSPEACMASISSGMDVLDVMCEGGVTDASISLAVERRLVTAYHQVGVGARRACVYARGDIGAP